MLIRRPGYMVRQILSLSMFAALMVMSLFFTTDVSAQAVNDTFRINEIEQTTQLASEDIRLIIARIISTALALLGVVAVGIVLYGGFVWMTAGGSDEKISQSKKIMINGAIGLAIILSSWGIARYVISVLSDAVGVSNEAEVGNPPAGCQNLADCMPSGGGRGGDCVERNNLFVVRAITPSTPNRNEGTGMSNIVVRAVFSNAVANNVRAQDVLRVQANGQDLANPIKTNFVSRTVVEAEYSVPVGVCDAFNNSLNAQQREEQRLNCLAAANNAYQVSVRDGIRDVSGKQLQENTDCGEFPKQAEFLVNEERIDRDRPIISPIRLNGQQGEVIVERGKSYPLTTAIADRSNGGNMGGVGYVRLILEKDGDSDDRFEGYYGPRVQDGSIKTFDFLRPIALGAGMKAPARFVSYVTAYDIDHNSQTVTSSFVLVGENCTNGRQDAGETAIDVGGQCLSDGRCQADWQCKSQRCVNNQCVEWPMITDVSPMDGAVGNLITIAGQYFGNEAGVVSFGLDTDRDGVLDNGSAWVDANLAQCSGNDVWHDEWVVVSVPLGLRQGSPYIIKIQKQGNNEFVDTTTNAHGPKPGSQQGLFEVNNNVRAGVCSVVTFDRTNPADPQKNGKTIGVANTGVRISGVNLGNGQNSTVYFGARSQRAEAWGEQTIDARVPENINAGKVGVAAEINGVRTNAVPFTIIDQNDLATRNPQVTAVDPGNTTRGSFVTIFGRNFGSQTGIVYASDNPAISCIDVNGAVRNGCSRLEVNLPDICGDTWSDSQIIVRIPSDLQLSQSMNRQGDNLVQDGTMEVKNLTAWTAYNPATPLEKWEKISEGAAEGIQAMQAVFLSEKPNVTAGFLQRNIVVAPNKRYKISFQYKGVGANNRFTATLFHGPTNRQPVTTNVTIDAPQQNWSTFEREFQTVDGENSLNLSFVIRGEMLFDNVQIVELIQEQIRTSEPFIVVVNSDNLSSDGQARLSIKEGNPQPSICKLSPSAGPAPLPNGQVLRIVGQNFSANPTVHFWTRNAAADDISTWLIARRNSGIVAADGFFVSTTIPVDQATGYSMASGPIRLRNDAGQVSNAVQYTVSRCTDPNAESPGDGFRCCLTGPDTGIWRPVGQTCAEEARTAGYSWRFTTGKIPEVPTVVEACNETDWAKMGIITDHPSPVPWSNWRQGNTACVNANIAVRFSADMDEATVENANNVALYTCPAAANGQTNCDDNKQLVNNLQPSYDAKVLTIWDGGVNGDLQPSTKYRVELSSNIKSFRMEAVGGQQVNIGGQLAATRPCGNGSAYCFEFTTGPGNRCVLTDAFVVPNTHTTNVLGWLKSGQAGPLYYLVKGRGNQTCSVMNVDGLGWQWNGDNEFARARRAPSAGGNGPFRDSRAEVEALAQTAPQSTPVVAKTTIGPTVNLLALAGVQNELQLQQKGNQVQLADIDGVANLTSGDTLAIDVTFTHHEFNTTTFEFNKQTSLWERRRYLVQKTGAYSVFVDESFSELENGSRRAKRTLYVQVFCDRFDLCVNEQVGVVRPAVLMSEIDGSQGGRQIFYVRFTQNSIVLEQSQDRRVVQTVAFRAQNNTRNNSPVVIGAFSPDSTNVFQGTLHALIKSSQTHPFTATSTLFIDLGDPRIIDYWPACTQSCANAVIGAVFNRLMVSSTFAGGFTLYECASEACDNLSADKQVPLLAIETSDAKSYRVQPVQPLKEDRWYLVQASNRIMSIGRLPQDGNPLLVGKPLVPFSWKFRTKTSDGLCLIDSVHVVPAQQVAQTIGEKTLYTAIPVSKADQCSAIGQELNPWGYGWDWQVADPLVATSSHFEYHGNFKPFCTIDCLPNGSTIARGSYTGEYAVCGNGQVDAGEDCDIAGNMPDGRPEVPGASCSFSCLRPGNERRANEALNEAQNAGSCGNGVIDYVAGEECDGNAGRFCTNTCTFSGSSNQATGDVNAPICGNEGGEVTLGEDCDLSIDPADARLPNQSRVGCSEQCLHTGTRISRAWCDTQQRPVGDTYNACLSSVSVCGNNVLEQGESCEIVNAQTIRVRTVNAQGEIVQTLVDGIENPARFCSNSCILGAVEKTRDNNFGLCNSGLAQCRAGSPGCNLDCTLSGSSVNHNPSSICTDGVVGVGEYPACEVTEARWDVIGQNPTQVITAVGQSLRIDEASQAQTTTILASTKVARLPDGLGGVTTTRINASGIGNYALQCGYQEFDAPVFVGGQSFENTVIDGDMEAPGTEFWLTTDAPFVTFEKIIEPSGNNSVLSLVTGIQSNREGDPRMSTVVKDNIQVTAGVRYQLSFRYKLREGELIVKRTLGAEVDTQVLRGRGDFWQQFDAEFVVSGKINRAALAFSLAYPQGISDRAEVMIDDVRIEEVSEEPPLYNDCPQNNDNGNGVATNSCCYRRPQRVSEYPRQEQGLAGNEAGVCRNTYIKTTYSGELLAESLSGNVIIAEGHEAGYNCAAHNLMDVSASIKRTSGALFAYGDDPGFFKKVWLAIKDFFISLFGGDAIAAVAPLVRDYPVWCAGDVVLSPSLRYEKQEDGNVLTHVSLQINDVLKGNTIYAVLLRGGKHGVRDVKGVGIASQKQVNRHFTQDDLFLFRTRQELCRIQSVQVEPTSYVFTEKNTNAVFTATAATEDEELIVPTPVYDWTWRWLPEEQKIFRLPAPPSNTTSAQILIGSTEVEGKMDAIAQAVVIRDEQLGSDVDRPVFSGITHLRSFFCVRPWPSQAQFPFEDKDYNISFGYCADDGVSGNTDDDLPFLLVSDIAREQSGVELVSESTLKRTFFFNDKNEDVIGIQVLSNPDRLSIEGWYRNYFKTGSTDGLTNVYVGPYPALTNGSTYYVGGLNEARPSVYNNIYIFSVNRNAQSSTKKVFEDIMSSLVFNTNITDHNFCLDSNIGVNDVRANVANWNKISNIPCTSDFDCRDTAGIPKPKTSGVCSNAKTKFFDDFKRLSQIRDIQRILESYKAKPESGNRYPQLTAGTFVPGYTNSRWNSWRDTLNVSQTDPLNTWTTCGEHDPQTCWDAQTALLQCPNFSRVFEYSVDAEDGYILHAPLEYFEPTLKVVSDFVSTTHFSTAPWCRANLQVNPFAGRCGDGVVNSNEQCEPGDVARVREASLIKDTSACEIDKKQCGNSLADCGYKVSLPNLNGLGKPTNPPPTFILRNGTKACVKNGVPNYVVNMSGSSVQGNYFSLVACSESSDCQQESTYIGQSFVLNENNQFVVKEKADLFALLQTDKNSFSCGDVAGITNDLTAVNKVQRCNISQQETETIVCAENGFADALAQCNQQCTWEVGSCQLNATCGNGVIDPTETCDDGVALNGTYGHCAGPASYQNDASRACKARHPLRCGDGVFTPAQEFCDASADQNRWKSYDVDKNKTCAWDCQSVGAYCGDGVVQAQQGETCDDGNNVSLDGCNSVCKEENIACKEANPNIQIQAVASTTLVFLKKGQLGTDLAPIPACFANTNGSEICGAYGLSCRQASSLAGGILPIPVGIGPNDPVVNSCATDLTQFQQSDVDTAFVINCAGVYAGEIVRNQTAVAGVCGNNTIDEGEACDLGNQNGRACTPEYNQTCTYCASDCSAIFTTDAVAYCGNRVVETAQGEQCESVPNGVLGTDGQPVRACEDVGSISCTNQCTLNTGCVECGFAGQGAGAEPFLSVLNPLGIAAAQENIVGWGDVTTARLYRKHPATGNKNQRFPNHYASYGFLPSIKNQVGAQSLVLPGSNKRIVTNQLCSSRWEVGFNVDSIIQNAGEFNENDLVRPQGFDWFQSDVTSDMVGYGNEDPRAFYNTALPEVLRRGLMNTLEYAVNDEVGRVDRAVVVSPAVPDEVYRVVVSWKKFGDNDQVQFLPNVYSEGFSQVYPDNAPKVVYKLGVQGINPNRVCNSFGQFLHFGQMYWWPNEDVCVPTNDIFVHGRVSQASQVVQSLTIDTSAYAAQMPAGSSSTYAVYVSAVSGGQPITIADYVNRNVKVEVYTSHEGQLPLLSIYKPQYVYDMSMAASSGNAFARYWHAFNLVKQDNRYTVQPVTKIVPVLQDGRNEYQAVPYTNGLITTNDCQIRNQIPGMFCEDNSPRE